jgi:hypothetical protein
MITIKPDSRLIPNTEFDFDELATWLQSLDLEGAAVSVTLHQPDGATQTLFSTR